MSTLTQTQIDQLIKDQIQTNPLAGLTSNPDIQAALANYVAEGQKLSNTLNASLTANYLVGFQNWSALVLAGKIPNTNPPQPPMGFIPAQASDGWTYVVRGVDPVCAQPPVPSIPQPPTNMVVAVGSFLTTSEKGEKFFSALPANANVPNGFTAQTTSADGVKGTFMWVSSPFGGWWEEVAPTLAAPAA